MTLMNKVIRNLGKKGYTVDPAVSRLDTFIIFRGKFFSLIRGLFLKIWLKESKGMLFVGRNCRIRHCHKIRIGRTITIGDNVEINALSRGGIRIGNNVTILRNSIIECTGVLRELGESLVIGDNVGIAQNCFIQVRGRVVIGSNVMFGPNVSIFSENHGHADTSIPMIEQETARKGVEIGEDNWLGSGSRILDGVKLGKGCIVAAGAVVTESFPEYSVIGGIPARLLRKRDTQQSLAYNLNQ